MSSDTQEPQLVPGQHDCVEDVVRQLYKCEAGPPGKDIKEKRPLRPQLQREALGSSTGRVVVQHAGCECSGASESLGTRGRIRRR